MKSILLLIWLSFLLTSCESGSGGNPNIFWAPKNLCKDGYNQIVTKDSYYFCIKSDIGYQP